METSDKRMLWIINFEKSKNDLESYYIEYEIASECYIPGLFNYKDGMILCGPMTMEKDKNGLYHYALKMKFSSPEALYNHKKAIESILQICR